MGLNVRESIQLINLKMYTLKKEYPFTFQRSESIKEFDHFFEKEICEKCIVNSVQNPNGFLYCNNDNESISSKIELSIFELTDFSDEISFSRCYIRTAYIRCRRKLFNFYRKKIEFENKYIKDLMRL